MVTKGIIISMLVILLALSGYILLTQSGDDLSEEELEEFFRNHTVAGNNAVAIKLNFTVPRPGTAYLGTIHGYPNNLSVCEELIAPYNEDPSLSAMPGGTYFCEELR